MLENSESLPKEEDRLDPTASFGAETLKACPAV
jgi:hypothetical protein